MLFSVLKAYFSENKLTISAIRWESWSPASIHTQRDAFCHLNYWLLHCKILSVMSHINEDFLYNSLLSFVIYSNSSHLMVAVIVFLCSHWQLFLKPFSVPPSKLLDYFNRDAKWREWKQLIRPEVNRKKDTPLFRTSWKYQMTDRAEWNIQRKAFPPHSEGYNGKSCLFSKLNLFPLSFHTLCFEWVSWIPRSWKFLSVSQSVKSS